MCVGCGPANMHIFLTFMPCRILILRHAVFNFAVLPVAKFDQIVSRCMHISWCSFTIFLGSCAIIFSVHFWVVFWPNSIRRAGYPRIPIDTQKRGDFRDTCCIEVLHHTYQYIQAVHSLIPSNSSLIPL